MRLLWVSTSLITTLLHHSLNEGLRQKQWHSKETAVALAEEGRLHAIVVHAKRGAYLRPEFHAKPFRDLVC